jgi:carbonic anhydrase
MRTILGTAVVVLSVLGLAGASLLASPAKPAAAGHDHPAEPSKVPEPSKPANAAGQAAGQPEAKPAPAGPDAAGHAAATPTVPADEAIRRLAAGNERFVSRSPQRPNQDQARLCDTFANGQHPYAGVLSCADSRVPPELVFDAGIGDLFVVRVAGNVADVDEVGTLEYGVEHLGINAILVMGHLKCGAVTAVVDKAHVTPNIEKLVDNIVPAAERARAAFPQLAGARLVEKAIRQNVYQSMADLTAKSDLLRDRAAAGTLTIVGGVYNLHTGEVDWLEQATPTVAGDSNSRAKPVPETHGKPAVDHPPAKPATGHAPAAGHGPAAGGPAVHGAPVAGVSNGVLAVPVEHADHPPTPAKPLAPASPAAPAKSENLLALGGLLGGGAAVSYGILHFIKRR